MTGWTAFWFYVTWASLITYFGLAVIITIGGFSDVRKMFRRLNAAHAAASGDSPASEPPSTPDPDGR